MGTVKNLSREKTERELWFQQDSPPLSVPFPTCSAHWSSNSFLPIFTMKKAGYVALLIINTQWLVFSIFKKGMSLISFSLWLLHHTANFDCPELPLHTVWLIPVQSQCSLYVLWVAVREKTWLISLCLFFQRFTPRQHSTRQAIDFGFGVGIYRLIFGAKTSFMI